MELATEDDMKRASSQGTILRIKVYGNTYGTKNPYDTGRSGLFSIDASTFLAVMSLMLLGGYDDDIDDLSLA